MSKRELRPDVLLAENIRALLAARGIDAHALATWCGHKPAWISKILAGDRGVPVRELGKIADFFGLTLSQLFQHGISALTERRRGVRRKGVERRTIMDRRQPADYERLHPSVTHRFPPPRYDERPRLTARSQEVIHGATSDPPDLQTAISKTDHVIDAANLLYELAERIRDLSSTVLARHAADIGDSPPDGAAASESLGREAGGPSAKKVR